jgi:zinc transporter 1/2/3
MVFQSIYAVIGIPVIFVLGFTGSLVPPLVALCWPSYNVTKKYYFSFFNGAAAGVILAVGFIHSLTDANSAFTAILTDPNSLTDGYPWANFIAMTAILILFALEEGMAIVANRFGISALDPHAHFEGESEGVHNTSEHSHHHHHEEHACDHTIDEHLANDGQCDAQPLEETCDHHQHGDEKESSSSEDDTTTTTRPTDPNSTKKKKKKVESLEVEGHPAPGKKKDAGSVSSFMKMLLLFIGLNMHNIFVGLALGISDNDYVLFLALIFHQFFEGLGMGSRVAMAKLGRLLYVLIVDLIFALVPVVFIGIGMGIKQGVDQADNTYAYNLTKGILQSLSAGILIYIALIHMMPAYRDNGSSAKHRDWHSVFSFLGLLGGTAVMSIIGIWA